MKIKICKPRRCLHLSCLPNDSYKSARFLFSALVLGVSLAIAAAASAAATFSYSLTTQNDPIAPGHVLEFDATVTNLTATAQSIELDFIVPQYTTYGSLGGGSSTYYNFGSVAAGASETAQLRFLVNGSSNIPPDGTIIKLTVTDSTRQISVARTATVRAFPVLNLQLSCEQGTVAPGGSFTYTLTPANLGQSSLSGTTLSATIPKGASFVSADGGGTLTGKTVTWNLGTLGVGANDQVHATFRASARAKSLGAITATATDTTGDVARASDTRVIYSAPAFAYSLTANPDPTAPGHVLEFDLTVTNLTAASQSVELDFTVPQYTTYGSLGAGAGTYYNFGSVAAGASETAKLRFTIVGSGAIPPDGATITLNAIDLARGASISRSAVVRSQPALDLQLSTEQGTVVPGGDFTYTFTTANLTGLSQTGAILVAAVPAGASFVSADSGGVLSGSVVTWTLGTLAVGQNTQVHATFQASSTPNAPLGPLDAIVSDNAGHVARASETSVVYSAPAFTYSLTANPDPGAPGHVLEFDLTVTNLAAVSQSVELDFTVPEFTTYGSLGAGAATYYNFGSVAAGGSETAKLRFTVVGSGNIPPDGTTITLHTIDLARGASVSRSAVVQAHPTINLQLSTEQGSVAPGEAFTFTFATANLSAATLGGTMLVAAVPAGASFVAADGGGVLDGGFVTWTLGNLRANSNAQVHATFQASSTPNTPLGSLDAMVSDSAGHVARASETSVVYSAPAFTYSLTANPDPAVPGRVLEFDLTVTNLSAASQSVELDFTVPEFTTYGSLGAGSATYYNFGSVAAGGSETAKLRFTVVGSGSIPPDGTTITLHTIDLARGASVSRSAVVQALPTLTLQLATDDGTVAPGAAFTYTLTSANVSSQNSRKVTLTAAVPAGASFVSADHGGRVSNGVVSWNLGTLRAQSDVEVHATFQADSEAGALGPFDAAVSDSAAHIARASDTRVIYAAPAFSYAITATPDPVAPGQVVEYDVTVTNLGAVSQSVEIDFTVPQYTTYGSLGGGSATYYNFGSVAAGASETKELFFTVVGSGSIPPDGTSITLDAIDLARGASVSHTVLVDSTP